VVGGEAGDRGTEEQSPAVQRKASFSPTIGLEQTDSCGNDPAVSLLRQNAVVPNGTVAVVSASTASPFPPEDEP
jgi:hypothetical protein